MSPRILLLLGDTAGVGPEICAKVAVDLPDEADGVQVVLVGDGRVLEEAQAVTSARRDLRRISAFDELDAVTDPLLLWDRRTEDPGSIPRRQVSVPAGREVLSALMEAIHLAKDGVIDGIVFAPFNKESMHKAGAKHSSEFDLFRDEFNRPDIPGEFNIIDELWLARVTSHLAVADISKTLSVERIIHTIELIAREQDQAGISPRLAVAALNPHAGEHGLFGDEEGRLIAPAIEAARALESHWVIDGPMPADTLFPRAMKGGYTGVVGMYHDQLQIASKLIGLERGVTLHPGMAVPIATAAHGVAFDIQGTGTANHTALRNAVAVVAAMAKNAAGARA